MISFINKFQIINKILTDSLNSFVNNAENQLLLAPIIALWRWNFSDSIIKQISDKYLKSWSPKQTKFFINNNLF